MNKTALFPGSFDPFTIGHESIVRRALPLFDKIIIAIGYNTNKMGFFPLEERLKWIKTVFEEDDKIEVESVHQMRVSIKKMRANLRFFEYCSERTFSKSDHFLIFLKLFKSAGIVRELQISQGIVDQLNLKDLSSLEQFIINKIEINGTYLIQQEEEFDHINYDKLNHDLFEVLKMIDLDILLKKIEKFVNLLFHKAKVF